MTEHHLPRRLRNRPVRKFQPRTLAEWAMATGYVRRHRHDRKRWPKSIIELLSESMFILDDPPWPERRKTLPECFTSATLVQFPW